MVVLRVVVVIFEIIPISFNNSTIKALLRRIQRINLDSNTKSIIID